MNGFQDGLFTEFPCGTFPPASEKNPTLISGLDPSLPSGHYVDYWIGMSLVSSDI